MSDKPMKVYVRNTRKGPIVTNREEVAGFWFSDGHEVYVLSIDEETGKLKREPF